MKPPHISLQIKSRQNVKERGEVFTAEREVKAMCNLPGVKETIADIEKRVLEPAAGNGNFLIEILQRRIDAILSAKKNPAEQAFCSLIALANIYAVELDAENISEAKQRLKEMIMSICGQEYEHAVDTILDTNIIEGNFLTRNKRAIPFYEYIPDYEQRTFTVSKHSLREILRTARKTRPNVSPDNIGQCIDELRHAEIAVTKRKTLFRDSDVHYVLQRSGHERKSVRKGNREWF